MRYVVNCDTICNVFLGDDIAYHSKSWLWNDIYVNYLIIIYELNTLPFVFKMYWRYC